MDASWPPSGHKGNINVVILHPVMFLIVIGYFYVAMIKQLMAVYASVFGT